MIRHKVLWVEGILLSQQHLQQAEAYQESQYRGLWKTQAPQAWGLCILEIDEDALLNGVFRVKQCLAVFQQGLLIEYRALEQAHLGCELKNNADEAIEIYLCLANSEQAAEIQGYPKAVQAATWRAVYTDVNDHYDVKRQREILFGQLNLCLLQNKCNSEAYYSLKIAEVKPSINGQFVLNKQFIPFIAWLGASPFLREMLQGLIELIRCKIRYLNEIISQLSEINDIRNWNSLLLSQELSRALPILQHLYLQNHTHPQELYLALAALYGVLLVHQAPEKRLPLPSYQHENLNSIYPQIEQLIKNLLNSIMPMKASSGLQLSNISKGLFLVEQIPKQLLTRASFFIAVKYTASNLQWTEQFIKQIKVGTKNTIETIIASALPGVFLRYIPHPPQRLPLKAGYEYFYLEPSGEYWRQVEKEESLAIFLTHYFMEAKVELVTIDE